MSMKTAVTMFAAACAATAGLYSVEVPAIAQPLPLLPLTPSTDCDWIVFSTGSDLDQGNGTVVHIEWGRTGGTASYSSQGYDWRGNLSGPVIVKGTNELDFSVSFGLVRQPNTDTPPPAATNNYSGSIDPGGTASGTWNNNSGASGTWTMGNTFKCIGKAPAQNSGTAAGGAAEQAPPPAEKPPTDMVRMLITPALPNVNVRVTSTAGIPGRCTYHADETNLGLAQPVDEAFDIAKMGTKNLTFPAPIIGQSWHVVLSCRGDFNGQDVEFGHQEQTVEGFLG